jgi:hypothetical protein
MAVPVYFSIQFVTAAILARRTIREARSSGGDASVGKALPTSA